MDLLVSNPGFVENVKSIVVKAYEPAFGIIGDQAKRDPHTRQSADHSMVYIVSTLLRKALELGATGSTDDLWKALMLAPVDYGKDALVNPATRALMEKISFEHGGPEYDAKYPDGIPTSMVVTLNDGTTLDSGFVMYPGGHARNTTADLGSILEHKWNLLGSLALADGSDVAANVGRLNSIGSMSSAQLLDIYQMDLASREAVD